MRMIDLTWNFKEKNGRCKHLYLYRKIFLLHIGCTNNFLKKALTIFCSALREDYFYFHHRQVSNKKERKIERFHCCRF